MPTELQYKSKLANLGVNLSGKVFQRKLKEAETDAWDRATQKTQVTDDVNKSLSIGVTRIVNVASVVGVSFMSVLVVLILFGLFVSEYLSVQHALNVFVGLWESRIIAIVFVSTIFVSLFITKVRNAKNTENYKFSFRLWVQNLAYVLGMGSNWEPESINEKQSEFMFSSRVNRLLLVTLIFLSAFGRLQPILEQTTDMNILDGMQYLLTQTSITDFAGMIGISFLTLSILLASEAVFNFIYANFVRLAGALELDPKENTAELYEKYLGDWFETEIAAAHAKKQQNQES